jgi:hypothetical protein
MALDSVNIHPSGCTGLFLFTLRIFAGRRALNYGPGTRRRLAAVWRGGYNSEMNIRRWLRRCVAVGVVFATASVTNLHSLGAGETAMTHASLLAAQERTSELEVSLFVQDPHLANDKKGVQVIWIPQPVQKYCLGKTPKECSTIDYCIRTTNKHGAICQNLGVDTAHLPAYPPDVSPRRVLSIVYFFPMDGAKGFGRLAEFFEKAPKGALDHLSKNARIRASVKLSRSADDDQFDVLEVLDVPSW